MAPRILVTLLGTISSRPERWRRGEAGTGSVVLFANERAGVESPTDAGKMNVPEVATGRGKRESDVSSSAGHRVQGH